MTLIKKLAETHLLVISLESRRAIHQRSAKIETFRPLSPLSPVLTRQVSTHSSDPKSIRVRFSANPKQIFVTQAILHFQLALKNRLGNLKQSRPLLAGLIQRCYGCAVWQCVLLLVEMHQSQGKKLVSS